MTATFLDCLYDRQELLLTGYARLLQLSYDIPLDIVATCHVFLSSHLTIPEITVSDSDDTEDEEDHLCEDEIDETQYVLQNDLFGIYEFIKYIKVRNVFTSLQYQSKLLSKYKNSYYSLKTGTNVIMHQIKNIFDSQINSKQTLKQLQILKQLRYHPHVQTLYDVVLPSNTSYFNSLTFILEYVDSNLYQIFRSNQYFEEIQIKYIIYQLLLAIKYIHESNIIHGDLRPENVLIANDCSVKICNFRNAICIGKHEKHQKHVTSTQKKKKRLRRSHRFRKTVDFYKAPEVTLYSSFKNAKNQRAIDVWSIGMIFAELLQMLKTNRISPRLRSPLIQKSYYKGEINAYLAVFQVIGSPTMHEIEKIQDGSVRNQLYDVAQYTFNKKKFKKQYYPGIDDCALDFLMAFITFDADKRMTIDEALNHPYLQHIRNPVYEGFIWKRKKNRYRDCLENIRECILKEVREYKRTK